MSLIFVYGTLKRGYRSHRELAGQKFLGRARTAPGYQLFALGDFPGMVAQAADRVGVEGEVWSIDDALLKHLDVFEGVPEGLYGREPVPLLAPFADQVVEAYLYLGSISGRAAIGPVWRE